jgi:hypothetical protein
VQAKLHAANWESGRPRAPFQGPCLQPTGASEHGSKTVLATPTSSLRERINIPISIASEVNPPDE